MTTIIGVDPGQTTGICAFDVGSRTGELLQCTPGAVLTVVAALAGRTPVPVLIAIERFVVSTRAGRSSTPKAGETTRDLVGELLGLASEQALIRVVQRSASEIKPWATDKRLEKAGLLVKGMPHAADAGRHALFAAVSDCGLPDPLSRSYRSPRRSTT